VVEIIVIVVSQGLGASAILAVGLSFWVGLLLSFTSHKLFTFGDKRMHHRILLPQLMAFSLLVLFNFGFTILITNLLAPRLPTVLIRTIVIAITTIWNFYLYKTRIFKANDNPVY
jgi:putative flippase GtrA